MSTALIIGAGVAGPVAAMALQRVGVDAVIYEAYATSADDVGAFLTLAPNGFNALSAIGADGVVSGIGFATSRMRFYSGTGKELGQAALGAGRDDGASYTLKRSDLYRALRDEAVRRGVRIEHGKRLVSATEAPGGVTATFADGTQAHGDLLIGCDGLRSVVRQVIDPTAPAARYVPALNIGGYASGVAASIPAGEYAMMFGKRAFFGWAVTPSGETWWFANPPRHDEPAEGELEAMTDAQWRAWLLELFADDRCPAADIIRATPGELRGWATYDVPTVPNWHSDSMIVIGDAAHATSPASGQGASMAIEDAVVLAQCLRDVPGVDAAFRAFVGVRRERVERIVAEGNKWSNRKVPGPVGRVIRDLVLPPIMRRMAAKGGGLDWVHEHRINWDSRVAA